jgi:DNA-directed RNA polymerase subunit RPC12/RpoP
MRRRIPNVDIKVTHIPEPNEEYQDGVFCKCGVSILIKNRKPYEEVEIVCPVCGCKMLYG